MRLRGPVVQGTQTSTIQQMQWCIYYRGLLHGYLIPNYPICCWEETENGSTEAQGKCHIYVMHIKAHQMGLLSSL